MIGVEILVSNEVVAESIFNWSVFWKVGGAFLGICLILGFVTSLIDSKWLSNMLSAVIIGVLGGAFAGGMLGTAYAIPVEYETQYKVITSDEILMNDFFNKYEIVDQEGKIYTVREINESTI